MSEHLVRIGSVWHYRRRVPTYCAEAVGKRVVQISTRRRDRAEALIVARRIDAETERHWRSVGAVTTHANAAQLVAYQRALIRARDRGFEYRTAEEIACGDIESLLQRVEALEKTKRGSPQEVEAEPLLGGVPRPCLMLSQLPERYRDLARDQLHGKSPKQVHLWRLPMIVP